MAQIATRCGVIAIAIVITLTAGEVHEELPPLDAQALGTLLIQRGGIAERGVEEQSVDQRQAEQNIEFAEAKAMADMGFARPQTPVEDLAALESQLHVQVAKAKAKLKKGAGGHSAKKAANLAKKVLALTKKVKKERKVSKIKKKAKAITKSKAGKAPAKDPISVRLTKARHNYLLREKKESAMVKADEGKVSSLTKLVTSLSERLTKAKTDLVNTRAALGRHKELYNFDFKAYQKVKAKESHRKKMVEIKESIRKQRERVRKEREEEEASNEQLQKYEERKKRLISYHAKRLASISGQTKTVPQSSTKHVVIGADAVAKAVAAVEKSIQDSHLEAQLKPKVRQLKAKLHGADLHAAIARLVSQAVASSVDADLQKDPTVKGAISNAVAQLRRKLGLPTKLVKNTRNVRSNSSNSGLAAKAKMQADAAVAKVQAARKSLNAANARLSKAVNAAGHKGLSFVDLLQV